MPLIAWRRCKVCLRPHDPAAGCGSRTGEVVKSADGSVRRVGWDPVRREVNGLPPPEKRRGKEQPGAAPAAPMTSAQRQAAYRARKAEAAKVLARKVAKKAAKKKGRA